jgi:hypothetical protein
MLQESGTKTQDTKAFQEAMFISLPAMQVTEAKGKV